MELIRTGPAMLQGPGSQCVHSHDLQTSLGARACQALWQDHAQIFIIPKD